MADTPDLLPHSNLRCSRAPWSRVTALCLLLALSLAGCGQKVKPTVTTIDVGTQLPTQESWKSTVTFSDSGHVRAVLYATHIAMYEEKKITLLDSGIVVDFYSSAGEHSSKLTARRGRVNDATRDLEAFENVVFRSDSGTVVHTEYLIWENARKKVRSDKFVTINAPNQHLQGYGFEAEQDLKNYTVFRVSGRTEFNEAPK